jgi:antitoxin component HigA of HigAB toxin-antitoxin module
LYNLYHNVTEEIFGNPIYILFPFLEKLPFFRRPELVKNMDKYQEFIEEVIKLKKEELENGTLQPNKDLVSAFVKSNENSEEDKLTMEQIRVTRSFLFKYIF